MRCALNFGESRAQIIAPSSVFSVFGFFLNYGSQRFEG